MHVRSPRLALAHAGHARRPPSPRAAAADDDAATAGSETPQRAPERSAMEPSESTEATADEPFGPGCASVPADGAGSFDGMADRRRSPPPRATTRCSRRS